LKKTLNLPNLKPLEQTERVEKIAKFHGIDPSKGIVDTKSFFKELGATSFTSIDITKDKRDDELALDLNYPQSFDGTFGLVVDFGTSTNLDVVSPKGEFLGGALAPGIEISVDALAARAAQLRKIELIKPKNVIGKNTVEALQSGTIFGFAGQVDGLVDRITAELADSYSEKPIVIATGGLAPLIVGVSETIEHYEPDLTLIGLRLIHERNA
jgi:type III pantothenate kinase